jgi:ABC-2 type transport system ATP-binding protein
MMFYAGLVAQVLLTLVGPAILARILRRRLGVRGHVVLWGALTFIASQVVHIPLNVALIPLVPKDHAAAWLLLPVLLGLTSGLCEEVARAVAVRLLPSEQRTGAHGLLFGVGHGGVEAILLVGLTGLLTLIARITIARAGLENLGLDELGLAAARAQIDAQEAYGGALPWLAIFERACAMTFHVAASLLVLRSVIERRPVFLGLAVILHATMNTSVLLVMARGGALAAELFLGLFTVIPVLVIARSLRVLPRFEKDPPNVPRPEASQAPIQLVGAHKTFGAGAKTVHALRGLDFELPVGARCALLGPNGAGKTTTIRLVTGALAPTKGHAFVFGASAEDPAFLMQKRRVGVVPQQPGMYSELTVRQYLQLVRDLYDCDHDWDLVRRVLDEDVLDRPMAALSGGMQRRLALAAALLPKPELLVLDEPSAGLDPVAARQMRAAVRDASVGRTTLLCTHDLDEAEELCDTVVILRKGRAALVGSIAELSRSMVPRVSIVARDPEKLWGELVKRGLVLGEDLAKSADAVTFELPDPEDALPILLSELLASGVAVLGCGIVRPKLEDLFFRVVAEEAVPKTPPTDEESRRGA